jgi:hypothetical protein
MSSPLAGSRDGSPAQSDVNLSRSVEFTPKEYTNVLLEYEYVFPCYLCTKGFGPEDFGMEMGSENDEDDEGSDAEGFERDIDCVDGGPSTSTKMIDWTAAGTTYVCRTVKYSALHELLWACFRYFIILLLLLFQIRVLILRKAFVLYPSDLN